MTLYWLATPWACGGVFVRDGKVVDGAPIFRKFRGQMLDELAKSYRVVKCDEPENK